MNFRERYQMHRTKGEFLAGHLKQKFRQFPQTIKKHQLLNFP